ncbi:MAG: helicase-associated domain-containing protein [Chloroflexota bacterium]
MAKRTQNRRFDNYLNNVNADQLKRMVHAYGNTPKKLKKENIAALKIILANAQQLRKVVNALDPFERQTLALIKKMGNIDEQDLTRHLVITGVELPELEEHRSYGRYALERLMELGLMMNPSRYYYSNYYTSEAFVDHRILAQVPPPVMHRLSLKAASDKTVSTLNPQSRLPSTVAFDLIGFIQKVENMDGLGVTQQQKVRVRELRQLEKSLKWPKGDLEIDGLIFKDIVLGLVAALTQARMFRQTTEKVVVAKSVETFAKKPFPEQISTLMNGFEKAEGWNELGSRYLSDTTVEVFRQTVLTFLRSLPLGSDDFYLLDDFDNALYERVGEFIGVAHYINKPQYYGRATPKQHQEREEKWRKDRRKSWLETERPWLNGAFSSWLYYLGLVEVAVENKAVVAFRLTKLGTAVLHPEENIDIDAIKTGRVNAKANGAWIVQPNFEIIAFLDQITTQQIIFLEQHAERSQTQQYTAHYLITRESVYQGLERGAKLEDFLRVLEKHAQTPIPQNVLIDIKEWAGLREQVTLHYTASLLSFVSEEERQKNVERGLKGTLVGDRYMLLDAKVAEGLKAVNTSDKLDHINYRHQLDPIVIVTEKGTMTLSKKATDLFLEPQLDHWAERTKEDTWQLTQASVSTQVKAGGRISDLFTLLEDRMVPRSRVAPFLETALRNWGGRTKSIQCESMVVLRFDSHDLYRTILEHKQIQPYLQGRLDPKEISKAARGREGDNVLLFKESDMKQVRKVLEWAGFDLSAIEVEE